MGDQKFKIWLVNEASSDDGWNDKIRTAVADRMRELFDKVCSGHAKFGSSETSWESAAPAAASVAEHELVLYYLSERKRSKVVKEGGDSVTRAGATWWKAGKGMISEVYVDESWGDGRPGMLFGNIGFHELMHNKLDAHPTLRTNSDIHTQGGGGLALEKVDAGSALTDGNVKLMRAALERKIKQYVG